MQVVEFAWLVYLAPGGILMDIRGAVDAAVPTNIIAAKAAEVRANKVNWQSYLQ